MFDTIKIFNKEVLHRSLESNFQKVRRWSDTLEDNWNVIIGFP
jgi:hypothetical protein